MEETAAEIVYFIGLFVIPVAVTGVLSWSVLRSFSREDLGLGLIEEIASSITLGLGGVGLLVLFLTERGIFNVIAYLLAVIVVNAALLVLLRINRISVNVKFGLACGGFLLLLILMASLALPPFEQVYGGRDGGVYINQSFWLARKGSFEFEIPLFDALSDETKEKFLFEFFRYQPANWRFLYLYPGFYWIRNKSTLDFQFLHLYPSILVPGMLVSVRPSLILTPLFGLISIVWLFILGKSIWGGKVGFLSAFLWAINPLFIWFSRYANAEILMLIFILAGIWGFVKAVGGERISVKTFAFICFGLSSLTKIEALLIIAPLMIACGALAWKRKDLSASVAPFVFLYSWSWFHILTFSRHYLQMTLAGVVSQMVKFSLTNIFFYLGLGMAAFFLLYFTLSLKRNGGFNLLIKMTALIWAIAGLIGYMLPLSLGIPAGFVPWGWFVSPALVLLASIGPLTIADDLGARNEARKAWVLFVFAGFFVMLSAKFAMYGDYPWGARRTISGAMPLFTLIGSYPLSKGIQHSKGLLKIGLVILLIVIIISCLPLDIKFLKHSEYGSAIETLEGFAAVFPENSIIIFEGSLPGSWLSLPLAFQKGQLPLVFWLDQPSMPTIDLEAIQEVVRKAEAFGMPVYLVTIESYDLTGQDCEFRLIKTIDLEVPTFEFLNYNGPPLNSKTWHFTLYIYKALWTLHLK